LPDIADELGLTPAKAASLRDAGIFTLERLKTCSPEFLHELDSWGRGTVNRVLAQISPTEAPVPPDSHWIDMLKAEGRIAERTSNVIRKLGVSSLRELLALTDDEIRIYNAGDITLSEIRAIPRDLFDGQDPTAAFRISVPTAEALGVAELAASLGAEPLVGAFDQLLESLAFDWTVFRSESAEQLISSRITGMLSDTQREVADARLFPHPAAQLSRTEAATHLKVTPQAIDKTEKRVVKDIKQVIEGDWLRSLLTQRLGPVVEEATALRLLSAHNRSEEIDLTWFLLDWAGYGLSEGWLFHTGPERSPKKAAIKRATEQVQASIAIAFNENETPAELARTDQIKDVVTQFQSEEALRTFLSDFYYELNTDVWAAKATHPNLVASALVEIGQPATAQDILKRCGDAQLTLKQVKNALSGADATEAAIQKGTYALKLWGLTGSLGSITDAIAATIREAGGSLSRTLVIDRLTGYGYKESSINTYISTVRFVTESGVVRLATAAEIDDWGPQRSLSSIADAAIADGRSGQIIRLTELHLGGNQIAVEREVAFFNGVTPTMNTKVPIASHLDRVASIRWDINDTNKKVGVGVLGASSFFPAIGVHVDDWVFVSPSTRDLVIRPATVSEINAKAERSQQ